MEKFHLIVEAFITLTIGVHSILFHTIAIYRAWNKLYHVRPNYRELCCIIFHDLGYLCSNETLGDDHPRYMRWIDRILKLDLIEGHSERYCKLIDRPKSKLWLPDKVSFKYISPRLLKMLWICDVSVKRHCTVENLVTKASTCEQTYLKEVLL